MAGSAKALELTEDPADTIGDTLDEVFTTPLTHKTSLYKQFQEEQRALRRDARNPNYEGKGIGKGGQKRKSAKATKKTPGPVVMEGWQDKEVIQALAGGTPSGAL